MDELQSIDTTGSKETVVHSQSTEEQPRIQETQPDALIGETIAVNANPTRPPSQQKQHFLPMTDFAVPSGLQIPLIVLLAIVGFIAILSLSSVFVPKKKKGGRKRRDGLDDDDDDDDAPPKSPTRKKKNEVTGSVMTPAGRRSARLRAKND